MRSVTASSSRGVDAVSPVPVTHDRSARRNGQEKRKKFTKIIQTCSSLCLRCLAHALRSVTSPSSSSALKLSRDSTAKPAKHKAQPAACVRCAQSCTRFVFCCRHDEGGLREGKRVRRTEQQKLGDNGKVGEQCNTVEVSQQLNLLKKKEKKCPKGKVGRGGLLHLKRVTE